MALQRFGYNVYKNSFCAGAHRAPSLLGQGLTNPASFWKANPLYLTIYIEVVLHYNIGLISRLVKAEVNSKL